MNSTHGTEPIYIIPAPSAVKGSWWTEASREGWQKAVGEAWTGRAMNKAEGSRKQRSEA
jgi:hypothetical protein